MTFEWDGRKADTNVEKHGVSFEEAMTIFLDDNALEGPDLDHSREEQRFRRLGRSAAGRLLAVAFTLRSGKDGQRIRLITARDASRRKREAYAPPD